MGEYEYRDAGPTYPPYLLPTVRQIASTVTGRAFDLGCGNGSTANMLHELGFDVCGVDVSESGVAQANKHYPQARIEVGSAYDDLASKYGKFDLVVSLEVIEHCYDPKQFMRTFVDLLAPGGVGVISTPYHGYAKNLALAVTGKLDQHFTALWDHGHIKFFSKQTLNELVAMSGARIDRLVRVGRIPVFARSMIAVIRRTH